MGLTWERAAGPANRQVPRTPLPPANQSYVLSALYGLPTGSVVAWNDGATWDGEAPPHSVLQLLFVLQVDPQVLPCEISRMFKMWL